MDGSDAELGAEQLRAHLAAKLPEYMVPAAYVRLEQLPLTPNGKLDRKALPAPEDDAYAAREYEAPQGEIEDGAGGDLGEVLKVERVGRHDNFFELGGHSLLAVTVIERMRRIGLQVDVRTLFDDADAGEVGGCRRSSRAMSSRFRRTGFRADCDIDHAGDAAAGGADAEEIERIVSGCRAERRTCRTSIRWRRCRRGYCFTI